MVRWVIGLNEIHKYLRRYSINLEDINLLEEKEKQILCIFNYPFFLIFILLIFVKLFIIK